MALSDVVILVGVHFPGETTAKSAHWSREQTSFTSAINVSNGVGSLLTMRAVVPADRRHGLLNQKRNGVQVKAGSNG